MVRVVRPPNRPRTGPRPAAASMRPWSTSRLTDENKLVREACAPSPRPRSCRTSASGTRRARSTARSSRKMGELGLPRGADPRGLRRRRDGLHQLRVAVRGARAGRYRVPCRPERPRRPQLAGPPAVGDARSSASAGSCPQARGREARDLRPRPSRGSGPTPATSRRTARRDGDVYRLNGQKIWISLADLADHFLVFASVDRAKKHKGVTAFMLERGMAGLTTGTLHGKLGIRAGNTGLINLDDVAGAGRRTGSARRARGSSSR